MKINMLKKFSISFFVLACIVYSGVKVSAISNESGIQQKIEIQNKQEVEALVDIGERFNSAQDYKSAVKVWSKAAKLDPNNQKIYRLIDNALEQAEYRAGLYKGWEKSENLKTPFTDELSMMSRQVNQNVENVKAQAAVKETVSQAASDKPALGEREVFIRKTFKDGQVFYDQGDYTSALNQWEKVVPLLPNGHELSKKINEFRDFLSKSKFFVTDKTNQDQAPALDQVILEQTVGKISDLMAGAQTKMKSAVPKDVVSRENKMKWAFLDGKIAFEKGHYEKAFQLWESITPYVEESAVQKAILEEYRDKLNPVSPVLLPGVPLKKGEIEEIPNRKSNN